MTQADIVRNQKMATQIDRHVVIKAMVHLKALKKSLRRLNKKNNPIWANAWNALFLERRKLIERFPAYQEAAWRMKIGQTVREREAGVFDIYDHWTDEFVPLLPTVPLKELDGVALEPGSQILVKSQGPNGLPDGTYVATQDAASVETLLKERTRKPHTNKQTHEQRQENGRRGAAKRDENRRRRLAKEKRNLQIYGINKGDKPLPIGHRGYSSMQAAFRYITNNLNSYNTFIVYDENGRRWDYDRQNHNMIQESID